MRALVANPTTQSGLELAEAPDPVAGPDEVLIEVKAVSLNFGDVNGIARAKPGTVPGWDAAGVVVQAAADGSGPAVGARVSSFHHNGAWAERRAVRTQDVGVVPDAVDFAVAAAVPVAGVTGVQSLRASGPIEGKRVLITGASGGVGRYTVQLAAAQGAHVIAAARRGEGLAELGADEVVSTLDGLDPVDVIIDTVGGPQLVQAWGLLAPGGVLQSIGWTSLEPATFPPYATVGQPKSLRAFEAVSPFGPDIEEVARLAAEGRLTVDLGWRGSWERFEEAVEALRGRRVAGKAVLELG
ncbi:zinc-binding dehydrogenase [Actinocrispum sp. NPDC049592]|uniref:zinc-binding dehydrogenase n=1 Tax=Actinocrispum sp. NPDC049592 TaxID=3154835 RepID=UPI00343FB1CD